MVAECIFLVFIAKTWVCQQAKDKVFVSQNIARRSHALDRCNSRQHISTLSLLTEITKRMDTIKTGKWGDTVITHKETKVDNYGHYSGNNENTAFRKRQYTAVFQIAEVEDDISNWTGFWINDAARSVDRDGWRSVIYAANPSTGGWH